MRPTKNSTEMEKKTQVGVAGYAILIANRWLKIRSGFFEAKVKQHMPRRGLVDGEISLSQGGGKKWRRATMRDTETFSEKNPGRRKVAINEMNNPRCAGENSSPYGKRER